MSELPKKCRQCNRPCGGHGMPAAWAVFEEKDSYWLCTKHHQESFLEVDNLIPLDDEESILSPYGTYPSSSD